MLDTLATISSYEEMFFQAAWADSGIWKKMSKRDKNQQVLRWCRITDPCNIATESHRSSRM